MISESGEVVGSRVEIPSTIDYSGLLKNTIIGCLTVMLDSAMTGPLKMENLRSGQDYTLWFRLLRDGRLAYGLDEDLARYRLVSGSLSRNKLDAARRMWKLYRDYECLSLPYSIWCFTNYAWNAVRKNRQ
jgi:teichuronic acid biosynthesis glycosyltransferase TuaG